FFSILVLCMVVVGGMGSIPGVILGSVVTGGLYFLTGQFGSYRVLIFGVLLVVVIILRPAGLLPSGRRKRELERVELEEGAIPPLAASAPETPGVPWASSARAGSRNPANPGRACWLAGCSPCGSAEW